MTKLKILGLLVISFFLMPKMYSQGEVSIHLGPSFPVSDFASDDSDDEDAGRAAVGLNIGMQYIYPLSESGLGLFGGIDFNYNGLQKDVRDDLEDELEMPGVSPDIKFYRYINIPISAGLNYTYPAGDKIGVFANAGLAYNFLKITDLEIEVDGRTATQEADWASSIGFKVGGGILINQKFAISIDYFSLGEHNVEGEYNAGGFSEDVEAEGKVDLLTLSLGLTIF